MADSTPERWYCAHCGAPSWMPPAGKCPDHPVPDSTPASERSAHGWGRYDGMTAEYVESIEKPDGIGWFPVSWVYWKVSEDLAALRDRAIAAEAEVKRLREAGDELAEQVRRELNMETQAPNTSAAVAAWHKARSLNTGSDDG
jgi:hypothetical protein